MLRPYTKWSDRRDRGEKFRGTKEKPGSLGGATRAGVTA
jgi:hypothetical protein